MKTKLYILLFIVLLVALFLGYKYYVNQKEADNSKIINELIEDKSDPKKILQRLYKTTPWEYKEDSYIDDVNYTYYSMNEKIKDSNTTIKGKVGTYPNDVGSEEDGYFSLTLVSKNKKELFKYEAYIIYDEVYYGTKYYDFTYSYVDTDGEKVNETGLGYYDENDKFTLVDRGKTLSEIEINRNNYNK